VNRRQIVKLLVAAPLLSRVTRAAANASTKGTGMTEHTGDIHDFDFLFGRWTALSRRLKVRGKGSQDWDEFPATHHCESWLGGIANVDEIVFPTKGFSGMTVRCFDVEKRRWAIYWINSRTGVLYPPVFGGFGGDRGDFYGEDTDDGRPVKVHFLWTRRGHDAARWEQAFSYDGKTWETNWVVEFKRTVA
jgi:hypothetical protein